MFQEFLNFAGLGIHPAFHIGDVVVLSVPVNALIVNEPCFVNIMKVVRHCCNIVTAVALVTAAPNQDAWVILVALIHRFCPVQTGFLPFRQRAGNIAGRLTNAHLLPRTVAFQIGFVDQIDTIFVAKLIPK